MEHFDRVELEQQSYAHRIEVDQREIETIKSQSQISSFGDEIRRQLIFEIRTKIYGKKHPPRHIIRYPADWLEALKERFAPSWIRHRWPVRFIEIEASLNEIYPEIKPELPHKNPVMLFSIQNRDSWPIW